MNMISIITPTYNRAYILWKLRESLRRQKKYNFEWIIIDDGSTDDTKKIVENWIKDEQKFSIQYFYQNNGGKHRALNYGIKLAKGDYIFIVDSDDYLTDDAIEIVENWIKTIDNNNNKIAGVAGLRGYSETKKIGEFPKNKEYIDVKNSHRYIHHLDGDKAEIYKREILLKYPFPEFEGEKFIGEGAVWNTLSLDNYKVRWFNKIIYLCEYLQDGLTHNVERLYKENFKGYTYSTKLNYKAIVFPYNLMALAVYINVAKECGFSEKWVKNNIEVSNFDWLLCKLIRMIRRMS